MDSSISQVCAPLVRSYSLYVLLGARIALSESHRWAALRTLDHAFRCEDAVPCVPGALSLPGVLSLPRVLSLPGRKGRSLPIQWVDASSYSHRWLCAFSAFLWVGLHPYGWAMGVHALLERRCCTLSTKKMCALSVKGTCAL